MQYKQTNRVSTSYMENLVIYAIGKRVARQVYYRAVLVMPLLLQLCHFANLYPKDRERLATNNKI